MQHASGVRSGSPEVLDALLRGDAVDPSDYYFRRTVRVETAAPRVARLEHALFVASCVRAADTVNDRAYRVA